MILHVVLFCFTKPVTERFVFPNGHEESTLFCLVGRYRNFCVWFMARNCRVQKVGTHGCQCGNHRLPVQGTAGSQRLELLVPNLGTTGNHCKQLPAPEVGTPSSQRANQKLPWQGTAGFQTLKRETKGYHGKELPVSRG